MTSMGRVVGLLLVLGTAAPALAMDNGPMFVVPGRRDVPVMINGLDASWGVVEGDWGLARPGQVSPTVIVPMCCERHWVHRNFGHYYPRTGRAPGYGRLERDPDAGKPPKPAESFHESWSAESPDLPATIMPPSYDMPGVVVAPGRGRW